MDKRPEFSIAGRTIGYDNDPLVIAAIGINQYRGLEL
jgi:sialic acid synthase SpsE